jgi:hypothetical protein
MKAATEWNVYRTRFLVRARQLTEPLSFVDVLGREHRGDTGDYVVESSDGSRRIAPREIFEDIYVVMDEMDDQCSIIARRDMLDQSRRAPSRRALMA